MRQPTALEQQQYQRLGELLDLARQRYLEAGGDPRHSVGDLKGQNHLSDEERQELFRLGRQAFGAYLRDS